MASLNFVTEIKKYHDAIFTVPNIFYSKLLVKLVTLDNYQKLSFNLEMQFLITTPC